MSVIIIDIVAGDSLVDFCFAESNHLASLVDVFGNIHIALSMLKVPKFSKVRQ
jgi:hypothetical protein